MTTYIYKGEKITHTRFITLMRSAGMESGYRKSHYEHLEEQAAKGNKKAEALLNDLQIID